MLQKLLDFHVYIYQGFVFTDDHLLITNHEFFKMETGKSAQFSKCPISALDVLYSYVLGS